MITGFCHALVTKVYSILYAYFVFSIQYYSHLMFFDVVPFWAELRRWAILNPTFWIGHQIYLNEGLGPWNLEFWRIVHNRCPHIIFDRWLQTTLIEFVENLFITSYRSHMKMRQFILHNDTCLLFFREYCIGTYIKFLGFYCGTKFILTFLLPYIVHYIDLS